MHGKRLRVTFTSPVGSNPPERHHKKDLYPNQRHVRSFCHFLPGEHWFHAAKRHPPLSSPDLPKNAGPSVQGLAFFCAHFGGLVLHRDPKLTENDMDRVDKCQWKVDAGRDRETFEGEADSGGRSSHGQAKPTS